MNNTNTIGFWALAALAASVLAVPAAYSQAELLANQHTERFSARLSGAEEVPPINTAGTADFEMTNQQGTITFSLTFSDLSSPLSVAHLHFAPGKVAGGVMIFLCGGGGQPACPATTEGTITGTITAANVTRAYRPGRKRGRSRLRFGSRARRSVLCQHAHSKLRRRRDSRPGSSRLGAR